MDSSQAVQKSRATIKSYRRTLAKRAAREVTFSDLSESELAQLFTTDEYESDYYRFQVSGFDVLVKNELLAENLLPFPVISAAANGDTNAMCAILKHYGGYIAKLCTRTLKDDAGNTYSYVDEEMRNRLQVRLITRTLAFHVG